MIKDKNMAIEEMIEKKLWGISNTLRGKLAAEAYSVLLLIISLYKDEVINMDSISDFTSVKEGIERAMISSSKVCINKYEGIVEVFYPFLDKIDIDEFKQVVFSLSELVDNNFTHLFDTILYNIYSQSLGKTNESIQPVELTELVFKLVDLPSNASVYNPFAGIASFGVMANEDFEYYGQELNKLTWAIGQLRLLAYKKDKKSIFNNEDSFLNWNKLDKKYDLVVSHPPFGYRLSREMREEIGVNSLDEFLITNGLKVLKEGGKLVSIHTVGLLFRRDSLELRRMLVEQDLIDSVILLSHGLLSRTGIPIVVLVLNKNKSQKGSIRLIDAREFVHDVSKTNRTIAVNELLSSIDEVYQDSAQIKMASNALVEKNDYNLNIPNYFIEDILGIELSHFLTPIRGRVTENFNEYDKLVHIKDLKNDAFDFELDIDTLEPVIKKSSNRLFLNKVDFSCLLVTLRGSSLRASWFEFKGEPIFVSREIDCFKVDKYKINPFFLTHELYSYHVSNQLNIFKVGTVAEVLSLDSFLKLKIVLPSEEEQFAKVEVLREYFQKLEDLKKIRDDIERGNKINEFNELASLKHTLGKPRQNILAGVRVLYNFMKKHESSFESLNQKFKEDVGLGEDMFTVLDEMKEDVLFMTEILEKSEKGLNNQFDSSIVSLHAIEEFIKSDLTDSKYNFHIKKSLFDDVELDVNADYFETNGIEIDLIQLKVLFVNILENASKYGFEVKSNQNEVVIELEIIQNSCRLKIKNNGKPFPDGFTKEKFISLYTTSDQKRGTGIGGHDINRIAQYYASEWDLELNEDLIYPVVFTFLFDIKEMNNE